MMTKLVSQKTPIQKYFDDISKEEYGNRLDPNSHKDNYSESSEYSVRN